METLQEAWTRFLAEYQVLEVGLASEFRSAWDDVCAILEDVRTGIRSFGTPGEDRRQLEALTALFEEEARRLLREPATRYQRGRPLQRTLATLEREEARLEELCRMLPSEVLPVQALAALGVAGPDGRRWLRWGDRSGEQALSLRGAVADRLRHERLLRAPAVGALQVAMARACLLLSSPWSHWNRWHLLRLAGEARPSGTLETAWTAWDSEIAELTRRAESELGQIAEAASTAAPRLTAALADSAREASASHRRRTTENLQRYFVYWSRQQRAVASVIDLQVRVANLGLEMARESARSLASLEGESRNLLQELDGAIGWLEGQQGGIPTSGLPRGEGTLVSAEERLADWVDRASSRARTLLPATVEALDPRRPLPGRRSHWRQLEPQRVMVEALAAGGPQAAREGFLEAEAAHRAILREVERTRETVDVILEKASSEGEAGPSLAREALENALGLLRHCRSEASLGFAPTVEMGLVHAQARVSLDAWAALEKRFFSLWTRATRERGRWVGRLAWGWSIRGLRAGSRVTARAAERGGHWLALKVGWTAPPEPAVEPLETRPHLGRILEVPLGERDLPMLYRRLFALSPVKDPRFLVGRAKEMAGLAALHARWREGQPVSGLIVGARGSGKTSLLNCAAASVFAGERIVQGALGNRLREPAEVHGFLSDLLELEPGADLLRALADDRRVILLEEFERSFLRAVEGFRALTELLRLIQGTARTTLWVVVTNDAAFRFLDAMVQLGQRFSHRINAMAVERQALVASILQRHHVSALRLQFAPPPPSRPRALTVRRSLGLERNAEEAFFEALYRQSEGVFRSGIELWLDSIERVEGGIVHMRQPLDPDYRPLEAELTTADRHVLKAILQHGSLTAEDLALVLSGAPAEHGLRLDRLQDLEIIEPDPSWPGHRIRPQAGRFVRHTLAAHNLLH
jgi:hypothetical protein